MREERRTSCDTNREKSYDLRGERRGKCLRAGIGLGPLPGPEVGPIRGPEAGVRRSLVFS
jgi:hypothetical protein